MGENLFPFLLETGVRAWRTESQSVTFMQMVRILAPFDLNHRVQSCSGSACWLAGTVSRTTGNYLSAYSVGDVTAADDEIGLLGVVVHNHCNRRDWDLNSVISYSVNNSGWPLGGTLSDIVRAQKFVDWRLVCRGEIYVVRAILNLVAMLPRSTAGGETS